VKHVILCFLLTIALILASGHTAHSQSKSSLIFVGDADYPPFEYLHDGIPDGFYSDITHALSLALKRPIAVQLTDWANAQQMVQDGRADAVIGVIISDERKKLFDFSDKVIAEEDPFAVRDNAYAVRKGNAALLADINRGLHILREQGEISRIRNKWTRQKVLYTTEEGFRIWLLKVTLIPLGLILVCLALWIALLKIQIKRRKASEEALKISEFRYRELYERTSKCVVVYKTIPGSEDFIIADVNRAAEEMEEISREEILGQPVLAAFPRLVPMGVIDVMKRVRQTGVAETCPITIRQSGRLITWCEYYVYKLPSGEIVTLYEYLTERKKMEEELRQSEEKFAKAFLSAPVLFAIIEADTGIHIDINEEAVKAVGLPREDIIGHTPVEIGWVTPESWQKVLHELNARGRMTNFEMDFHPRDGRTMTGLVGGERLFISGREYVMFIALDITPRKMAERRQEMITGILTLLSSEKDIRTLIRDIVVLIRNYTTFESVAIRLKEGQDYPYFETSGFADDFVEKEKYLCERDDNNNIVRDASGSPVLECMCGNILRGRTDTAFPFFTAGGSFWTNGTTALLASTTEADRQSRTRNRCNGEGYESVALIPLKAGNEIIGLLQLNDRRKDLFTPDMIRHLEGIGVSIGASIQRIHAEEALVEAENRMQLTFDNANIGVCLIGMDGRLLRVNREMANILGYDRAEIESLTVNDITHPEDREFTPTAISETFTDRGVQAVFEIRYLRKDGQIACCRVSSSLIKDAKSRPLYFISHVQDITQHRQMEQRLQRAERMEALGLLAGGVAHDLNNVIGISIGYSEMLLDDMDPDSPLREHVENIMQATERASAIVQDMLTMARRNVAVNKVMNLNTVIAEFLNSPEFSSLLAKHPGVEIQTALSPDLLNINGSPIHLSKTVMNLIANAAEAIPECGVIRVSSQNVHLDRPVKGYDSFKEGDYAVLCISDTGEGISAENLPRIFEPFYTKKVMGRSGTGLGLAVVWGAVKDHNGYIDVESAPGQGTTFSLYFPVCREEIREAPEAIGRTSYMGKGEKILVVDDVPEQRELAVRLLTKLNYMTASVASGEEAVEFLRTTKVDLLVLDMIMDPGIDGLATYQRILEFEPGQKAIIVSGFAETERVSEAQRLGAGAYVKKPYIIETLGLAIKQELDRKK